METYTQTVTCPALLKQIQRENASMAGAYMYRTSQCQLLLINMCSLSSTDKTVLLQDLVLPAHQRAKLVAGEPLSHLFLVSMYFCCTLATGFRHF